MDTRSSCPPRQWALRGDIRSSCPPRQWALRGDIRSSCPPRQWALRGDIRSSCPPRQWALKGDIRSSCPPRQWALRRAAGNEAQYASVRIECIEENMAFSGILIVGPPLPSKACARIVLPLGGKADRTSPGQGQ